jgi:hypothetical protein
VGAWERIVIVFVFVLIGEFVDIALAVDGVLESLH